MSTRRVSAGFVAALALSLVFLALLHGAMLLLAHTPLSERPLSGADAYDRLTQVTELHRAGWYQDRVPRANTPYGEPRVWSRAFDLVLWPVAVALTPLLGFARALHVWGVLAPPVLHLLTLLVLFWAARPLLGRESFFYLGLLFPFQISVTAQYLAGRPDHHPFLGLLFVVVVGATLRLLTGGRRGAAIVAGLALAASLWVSVEALIVAAVVLLALGLAWLGRRLDARRIAALTLSLVAGLVVVLAVERPPASWGQVAYDRVSIVHLLLFLTLAVMVCLAALLERAGRLETARARVLAMLLAALVAGAVQLLVFPSFFAGPMADIPPEVRDLNIGRTSEYGAVIDPSSLHRSLYLLLVYLGGAVIAVPVLAFLVLRTIARNRAAWRFLAFALAVYLALALYQIRWGLYAELLALPALAVLLRHFGRMIENRRLVAGLGTRASFKFTAMLLVAVAPIAAGWSVRPAAEVAPIAGPRCDVAAIAGFLMRTPPFAARPYRIVNFAYDGPELLYRTHHEVVATPNHRNGAGLLDARAFFAARDPARAHAIARKRGLELALLCPSDHEGSYYRAPGQHVLWDDLRDGTAPSWLRPVALPAALGTDFRLFRIVE